MVVTTSPPQTQTEQARRVYAGHAICSATLLLLVIAERWLLSLHTFPGDYWAAQLGHQVVRTHSPWLVWAITRVYQQTGRPLVAIGEVLVMFTWLWRSAGRRAAQGLLIVLLASATCGLIKIICGPTPLWTSLYHVGTNFPSGVVTFMTASVGYVGLVARRQGRTVLPLILLAVIFGAGPARVLGGQHLPSDVIGGYMLGAAWLLAAHAYMIGRVRRRDRETPWRIATRSAATSNPAAEPAMMRSF